MSEPMRYERIEGAGESLDAVARATGLAFGAQLPGVHEWLAFAGMDNIRVLRTPAGVGASLIALPMGQFFGGRSVAMQGVAGVAVAPEARGGGLALRLMREQIREAASEGIPLSCLYASTQSLYRQVGYEQAGLLFCTHIPLRTIGVRDRSMPVRELGESDEERVRACSREVAARHNGMLDRGPYIWGRIRKSRDEAYAGFGVFAPDEPGRLEGYLYMSQRRKPDSGRHDISLSDLAFTTPRAGRRLLGFLADLATVGDDAVVYGPPLHPICTLMPQQYHTSKFVDAWMIRINLVKEALEARGYAHGLDVSLAVEIEDDIVPANNGTWRIHVRDGCARVEPGGGDAVLRCDARGFAAVYSGFYSATQAAALGLIRGDAGAISGADAVFAGPTPSMCDRF